jgi:hypothetical protein
MAKTERLKAKMREQRKISLEECCETHLRNPVFKDGMANLMELFRNLKMKPCWYHSTSYKCYYKKEVVIYVTVYNDNCNIKVATVSAADNVGRVGVNDFVRTLNDEMKTEFISHFKPCSGCGGCAPGYDVEVDGVTHKGICKGTLVYNINNPTTEQFIWIKKFIIARREYISNTAV